MDRGKTNQVPNALDECLQIFFARGWRDKGSIGIEQRCALAELPHHDRGAIATAANAEFTPAQGVCLPHTAPVSHEEQEDFFLQEKLGCAENPLDAVGHLATRQLQHHTGLDDGSLENLVNLDGDASDNALVDLVDKGADGGDAAENDRFRAFH